MEFLRIVIDIYNGMQEVSSLIDLYTTSLRRIGRYMLVSSSLMTHLFVRNGLEYNVIGLEQRKTNLIQMQLMLYVLLDSPPSYFIAEVKPEQILLINKHRDMETITDFLQNIIYPPLDIMVIVLHLIVWMTL